MWNERGRINLHSYHIPANFSTSSAGYQNTNCSVAFSNPLTLNLGITGLKVTSEPPPMADCLQDHSAVTHPSSSLTRRCLTTLVVLAIPNTVKEVKL
ncbi:hypothetical protein J6590_068637 [Homalodisca vitripennis]|nr:hypothetical protein J6590_068637 [Homalodisca vitripennis]